MRKVAKFSLAVLLLSPTFAVELNNSTSLDVSITGVFQQAEFYKSISGSEGKGSVATDIGLNFHPTPSDEAQITLSFAAGNGLKRTFADRGFALMPNADDLEDDLKDINGRSRDYLLEAWYKHTFHYEGWSIAPAAGIIDATAYIDDNDYANDETVQFMNDVFVNNPLANLPSYDLGGLVDISKGVLDLKALVMNSRNDAGKNYDYYALQIGFYGIKTSSVEGNYRIYYYRTSKDFENYRGNPDRIEGLGFSGDWTLGKIGLFGRLGVNTNTDTGDFKNLISGGLHYGFETFKKPSSVALGLAHLEGNKKVSGISSVDAAEAYYKIGLNKYCELTLDVQYQKQNQEGGDIAALTYGVRFNASF